MSEPFLGEIRMFGGNFAPRGWAQCNGQLLAISQNTALFSILGVQYGGNGQTTFGLPDLRGRVAVNWGQGPGLSNYSIGEVTGAENVTLTQNQMPAHVHSFAPPCSNVTAGLTDPTNNYLGAQDPNTGAILLFNPTANATMKAANTSQAGASQPTPVLQPLLCVTFIIALQGIFPSRN